MQAKVPFVKMQSVGNDFVLLDGRTVGKQDYAKLAVDMCDRHFGIGADGLLLVFRRKDRDFSFLMFNPDGSEDTCGNGLRCAVKYWIESHPAYRRAGRKRLLVEHRSGVSEVTAVVNDGLAGRVTASMGAPDFDPRAVPVRSDRELLNARMRVEGQWLRLSCVCMGSTHTVIVSENNPLKSAIPAVSRAIETHVMFPQRTSVIWAHIQSERCIQVRIWERGVGETLGCGTGACAAVVVAARLGRAKPQARVVSPGGELEVEWRGEGEVFLTGEAFELFRGAWSSCPRRGIGGALRGLESNI